MSASDKAVCDLHNQSATGAPISFQGKAEPGKAVDCMLVFDPDDNGGSFRLEGVAVTVKNLTHDRRGGEMAAHRLASIDTASSTANQAPAPLQPDLDSIIDDTDDNDDDELEGSEDSFSE